MNKKKWTGFLKKCAMPLAIAFIIIAILFSLFRALTPWAKQYKGQVEQHLSVLLGQPVTISNMETSWYWFEPVLKMDQVVLSDKQDHVLTFNKLLVGINLFSSLWHWQIEPGVLFVEDVHLIMRQVGHHWDVEGLRQDKQSTTIESESYLQILGWVLAQQKIIIKHVSADVHFSDGTFVPLRELNLTTKHSYGHYRVKGSARLEQKNTTELSVIADMQLDPSALKNASGHAYLSVKNFLPAQWQGFFPNTGYRIKDGEGNVELWLDVVKGHFFSLQSLLDCNHVVWNQEGKSKQHVIEQFKANLALRTTSQGWRLTGDHINLSLDGFVWPENALQLDYKRSQHRYHAFLKALSIESLLATDMTLPDSVQSLLSHHPRGDLADTQLVMTAQKMDFLLTGFSNVGWNGRGEAPSVSHLSGVLSWQPTEGHLELDGEGTTITFKQLPPIVWDEFNGAFDWKQLTNGWRVSMDRFVLSRPDMVVSAQGVLDDPLLPTANLRLTADFSATKARHWIDYIPTRYLKPKLNAWLKQDIKRVNKATGQLVINGPWVDFPFDKQPGVFSINSYLNGVDLFFGKNWPLTRDIDAHLQVDKRVLDVSVSHADLQGVAVNQLSLVVNDIGLGQEALLIHGAINAPVEKIKNYVFASPLNARFSRWKKIDISDTLNLDLRLEIPLYPESDHVFARGALTFDDNNVILHHARNDILVDKLSGVLKFDETGITQSELKGSLAGDPIAITIQSIRKPKAYVEVNVEGSTSVDFIQKKFPSPLLERMDGHLNIHGLLTLMDDPNDMDHMQITSSMQGIAIDLPAPLGKLSNETVPLTVDVAFNDNHLELQLAYRDLQIKARELASNDWSFNVKEKDINADLRYQSALNALTGHIEHLYLPDSLLLNNKVKPAKTLFRPDDIPNINVTIDQVRLAQVDLGKVSLKSTSSEDVWALEYCKIQSPDYQMNIQGNWKQLGNQSNTHMEFDLQLLDLGKALARWNIIPAVEAHRGSVTFKGGWQGGMNDFSLDKLAGNAQITLKNGRITHLDKDTEEKLGLGKLLSVLSLQTIPRRLSLDFSDLSKTGYSFDEFKGSFVVKNGVMNTQDSYIDGPVAYASMKGDLDLAKHLYDVDLRVSPYIMASLPIVVTIAGGPIAGPIAGIATWVASKLINKGMQQISAYTYKISGPWQDPVVQQVKIYKKRKAS